MALTREGNNRHHKTPPWYWSTVTKNATQPQTMHKTTTPTTIPIVRDELALAGLTASGFGPAGTFPA
jgi:hypothetical protein